MTSLPNIPSTVPRETIGMRTITISTPHFYENAVTPDALYIYLSTRLQGLDEKINGVFEKQKASDKVRGALNEIKTQLAKLETKDREPDSIIASETGEPFQNIRNQIEIIRAVDSNLAVRLEADLSHRESGILHERDHTYTTLQHTASAELIDNVTKDLEATAQLDMILLQSTMSARQTAIQLATNLTASLADSLKNIVGNLGR